MTSNSTATPHVPTVPATMTAADGVVTVTLADGRTFTAQERGLFVKNLDRQMKKEGLYRDAWAAVDGVLTTTFFDYRA